MAKDPTVILKAISSPVRMQILHELGFHDGRARVTDIADALELAPNSVSYHLKELEKAAVVERIPTPDGRDARETWYAVVDGVIELDLDTLGGDVPVATLVDALYDANTNSEVVARYRRAAMEADDVSNDRLIGMMNVLRLTPEQERQFFTDVKELFARVSRESENNLEKFHDGAVASDATVQIYVDVDMFPVVEPKAGRVAQ